MPENKKPEYTGSETEIQQDLSYIKQYWVPRNQYIEEARRYMSGRNLIQVPSSTRYKIKPIHTYVLAALVNEKLSRFMSIPRIQVIPNDEVDPDGRAWSTRIEKAINVFQYEMERLGDGSVWDKVVLDCILIDGGVERIDRAPAHFWPEMVAAELAGMPYTDKKRDDYKKEKGCCLKSTYVPMEYVYPVYDGNFIECNYEYEIRSLNSVLKAFPDTSRPFSVLKDDNKTKDIVIVHYTEANWHAIYGILPSSGSYSNQMRNDRENVWLRSEGELIYLDSYYHGLGRVPYNFVSGRFGGWKTSEGAILDIGKGILHHNEIIDELATQVYTSIRATKWPGWLFKVDPERRGFNEKGPPTAPTIPEGGDIAMYVGEELQPIMQPQEDPVVSWFYTLMQNQLTRLGGNPALFGENQPGVRTGYQQALQIAEAEGVDRKLEEHLAQGAITRATLMSLHIRELDETVWAHYTEQHSGKKTGQYIYINPEDLTPLPRFDAKVRERRPVDYIAALRAAKEASDDRQGKGPLLSDDTIRAEILTVDEPDTEELKLLFQRGKNKILDSGIFEKRVGDALNIKMAKEAAPPMNPGMLTNPAFQQAAGMFAGQSVNGGGINPQNLQQLGPAGVPSGPVATESQPENRIGEELSRAESL